MPEVRFPRLEPDSTWRAFPERRYVADSAAIRAVMYFPEISPEGEKLRAEFLDAVEAYNLVETIHWENRRSNPMSADVLGRYVYARSPEQTLANAERHMGWRGELVGRVLIRVRATRSSLTKSFRYIEDAAKQAPKLAPDAPKETFRGFRVSNLRQNVWGRYQSVAHFWAALALMRWEPSCTFFPDVFRRFLAISEWLRRQGEGYRPPQRASALLEPAKTWTLPPEMVPDLSRFDLPPLARPELDLGRVVYPAIVAEAAAIGHLILPAGLGPLGNAIAGVASAQLSVSRP